MRALVADPDVGVLLLYLTSMPFFAARTRTLAQAALDGGKPVLAVMLPGPAGEQPRAVLRELNCPYFDSVEDLLAALRGMFDYHRLAVTPEAPQRPADLPDAVAADWTICRSLLRRTASPCHGPWPARTLNRQMQQRVRSDFPSC